MEITRNVFRWICRIILLFFGACGILTLMTYYRGAYYISEPTIKFAWVISIGSLIAFSLSFIDFDRGKEN